MQSTRQKQQFTWANKIVDGLISSFENFIALMELERKYFDKERQAQ